MDYHFNVSFYCLYSNIQCDCGVLSNNILHNILNVRIQTIKTYLGNIFSSTGFGWAAAAPTLASAASAAASSPAAA